MSIIKDMWGYADIGYKEPLNKKQLVSLSKDKYNIQEPDKYQYRLDKTDFAFIAEDSHHIIISFRGTDNFKGWLSDFDVYPLQELKMIHQGFYDSWSFFKPWIDKYIESYNGKDLFIIGHSRGAAFAVLCARHLAKNRNIKGSSCIVYGCPRIGTKEFRDQFNKLPIDCTRITNGFDLVTRIPTHLMGFRHVGKNIRLKQPLFHKWFLKIFDHLPKNYKKSLQKKYS